MSNKLIITEEQYSKLKEFIFETRFDKFLTKSVKDGDIVRITIGDNASNYVVTNNTNGQVQLDNVDKGSTNINNRIFISMTSLDGNKLQIKQVNKLKEKDKLKDVNSWKVLNLNNIKSIEVLRNGAVVDTVDEPTDKVNPVKPNTKGPEDDETKNKLSDALLLLLNGLEEGKSLDFTMSDDSVVRFCCLSKSNNVFNFELIEDDNLLNKKLKDWDSYTIKIKNGGGGEDDSVDLYELNKTIITSVDSGATFSLMFVGHSADNKKPIPLEGIKHFNIGDCNVTDDDDDEDNEDDDDKTKKDKLVKRGKKAFDYILKDPNLQEAFYKQPSLFKLFQAELTGKVATGTGIITILNIVHDYANKQSNEKLGGTFTKDKKVIFSPLREVAIPFQNKNGQSETFIMSPNESYTATVKNTQLNSTDRIIENYAEGFRIFVKNKTEQSDVFLCQVTKLVTINKVKKRFSSKELVRIKFSGESPGYSPLKSNKNPAKVTPKPTK
jgi:hypothetical protein